ncbi:MAG TPA: hypothetical protein VFT82_00260 [Candidatus Paceibacterota bacterium]|nr:hypothetical protein [Candidatus Paceibacterota bacterium]
MNRLWIMYDLGGISYGRTERAALLESVIDLTSLRFRADLVETELLIREAYGRKIPKWEMFPEFIVPLPHICFAHFSQLCIDTMGEWYAQDPLVEVRPGEYVSIAEKRIYDAIAHITDAREEASKLRAHGINPSARELIEEGRQRKRGGKIF